MKPAKSLLAILAFFGAAFSASAAAPDAVIHITGSTAFRQATNVSIFHSFTGGSNGHTDIAVATTGTGTAFNGAGSLYFRGTMGGKDVVVETFFSGSTGGIYSLTHNTALSFFADNTDSLSGCAFLAASANPSAFSFSSAAGGGTLPLPGTNVVPAEMTMADSLQTSTPFVSPVLTPATITSDGSQGIVGVIPFAWLKGKTGVAAASGLTNVSPSLIQSLYGGLGHLPLSVFTGVNADETVSVYGAGRDPDSGTRTITFSEAGLGSNAFVQQWQPASGATYGIANLSRTPSGYLANLGGSAGGILIATGNNGASSGGTLAGYLKNQTCTDGVLLGYTGVSDAVGVLDAGGVALSWNGVNLFDTPTSSASLNLTNVREGKYTFWSYEQVLYNAALASAAQVTAINTIATQIHDVDAASQGQVAVSTMKVVRASDGAVITPNF